MSELSSARTSKNRTSLDRLLDLYWGGSERRITNLTLKILAVNVIALLILLLGIIYLGQYHNNLIEARLRTFQREVALVSVALSQSPLWDVQTGGLMENKLEGVIDLLALDEDKTLYLFDGQGRLVVKTEDAFGLSYGEPHFSRFQGFEFIKESLRFLLAWFPDRQELPHYPDIRESVHAEDFPGVDESLGGAKMLSAWTGAESRIFLSASVPLIQQGVFGGVLLLTWEGHEIEGDLDAVFLTVLQIFIGTLLLTILLSIYLSGLIARPLKKLMKAAENVRKGHGRAEDIPDFSYRFDEIGELSLVLRDMTMALSERMDMMERFAADVSHELKNPLTSLRSAFETLSIVKKKQDKERLVEIISHDLNRLDRLITDISRASRLDTALSREGFEQIDLQSLLHQVLQIHDDPLERSRTMEGWLCSTVSNDVRLCLNCAVQEAIYVQGLEGYLAQVFDNILFNALSFSPAGGEISITVSLLKRRVAISIENQGPPIPEGRLGTIFERFYSQRPDHEAYGHHSGLGLSICKQIVDAHGGQIFAENTVDEQGKHKGVRFTVLLSQS